MRTILSLSTARRWLILPLLLPTGEPHSSGKGCVATQLMIDGDLMHGSTYHLSVSTKCSELA